MHLRRQRLTLVGLLKGVGHSDFSDSLKIMAGAAKRGIGFIPLDSTLSRVLPFQLKSISNFEAA